MTLSPEAKAQMDELERRRRPLYEDPGRFGPRTIGTLALVDVGWEVWTTEFGRRNADLEPLGGIVLAVDPGGKVTDEWGVITYCPARFRTYDAQAEWPHKSFRWISEDEVNREFGVGAPNPADLVTAIRRFCREVGRGGRVLDAFDADLVLEAGRLVAVVMGAVTPAQRRRKARARQAAELRAKGFSLRDIAAYLGVDHETVRQDLRRLQMSRKVASENSPFGGEKSPANLDSNIVQLRREAQ